MSFLTFDAQEQAVAQDPDWILRSEIMKTKKKISQ